MDKILEKYTPKLFNFNIGADSAWTPGNTGVRKVSSRYGTIIPLYQGEMNIFISREEDYVILLKQPDDEFLEDMNRLGFSIPKILLEEPGSGKDSNLSRHLWENDSSMERLAELQKNHTGAALTYFPYIVTPYDHKICEKTGMKLWGAPSGAVKRVNNKLYTRGLAEKLNLKTTRGYSCTSAAELEEKYTALTAAGYTGCVVKETFGSSGKGTYYIKDKKFFNNILKLIRFPKKKTGYEIIVEGWVNKKSDINYQVVITETGDIRQVALNEQIIEQTTFRGTIYPPRLTKHQQQELEKAAVQVAKAIYKQGYWGIIGIDAIIDENDLVYPMLEINGRFNLSTYFIPFIRRCEKWERRSLFKYYDLQTRKKIGYSDVKRVLQKTGKSFSSATKEGLILLNSGCLSADYEKKQDIYYSRLFLASLKDKKKTPQEIIAGMDEAAKTVQQELQ
ncbi:MAG: ATP-grasp domain-containing protein [bacterium]|nr:ATP-grasp domain-containing protein [bacterium]